MSTPSPDKPSLEASHGMSDEYRDQYQKTAQALTERVKELTCLYELSRLIEKPDITLPQILQGTVTLLPPAFQFPDLTAARLTWEGQRYTSPAFRESDQQLHRPICVQQKEKGRLEIHVAALPEGKAQIPFLPEEALLVEVVAERLGRVIERIRFKEELKAKNTRLEALLSISALAEADMKSISDHILGTLTKMTDSPYGFYGFINDDESAMTIHSWSGAAMKDCSIEQKPCTFQICEAGVWSEAVRKRQPLILNHYQAHHPAKKGLPAGHVPLTRLLVVPFINRGRIKSLAAVANRMKEYGPEDITQINSFLSSIQAMVENKKNEEALRESEARFKSLHNASFGGIAIHDRGLILECNQGLSEITGYPQTELIGMNGLLLIDESSREEVMKNISSGYEKPYEVFGVRKNGESYPLRLEARNVPYKGKMVRTVEFRDISEQKAAQEEHEKLREQLNQAQKMESVGRLAGGVAHDFNNMLGVILGHTELIMDQIDPSQSIYADLREIHKAAERSANLTRQLLAFARKQTITPTILNLNDIVSSMLKMLRRLIGEDIELVWLPGSEPIVVNMDPSQIDQILANLCVNARDAIESSGRIIIETRASTVDETLCNQNHDATPGEYALLSISDTGSGMSQQTLRNLFEPFFTTKDLGKGTGLGLATVYGIVRQNQGFITVDSEEGMGSRFQVYLPLSREKPEKSRNAPPRVPKSSEHKTVLLVEDEPSILKMTSLMLQRLGFTVLPSSSPQESLYIAGNTAEVIDLLITDIIMPEMNGRDLARRLKQLYPDIRTLFMSGYTADVIANHGIIDEGVNFIQKPFTLKELGREIQKTLGGEGRSSIQSP